MCRLPGVSGFSQYPQSQPPGVSGLPQYSHSRTPDLLGLPLYLSSNLIVSRGLLSTYSAQLKVSQGFRSATQCFTILPRNADRHDYLYNIGFLIKYFQLNQRINLI